MKTKFTSTGSTSIWTEERLFTITTITSRIIKEGDGFITVNESSTSLSPTGIACVISFAAMCVAYLISLA